MINLCKAIDCPYFSDDHAKSYGCQRYSTAALCHLRFYRASESSPTLLDPRIHSEATEYALFANDLTEEDITSLRRKNERIMINSARYGSDLKLMEDGVELAFPKRLINKPEDNV